MNRHVPMRAKVEAYLSFRRGLGFRLKVEGGMLRQFAAFADAAGHRGPLTTEFLLLWAQATTSTDRLYAARRLEVVRCLARLSPRRRRERRSLVVACSAGHTEGLSLTSTLVPK